MSKNKHIDVKGLQIFDRVVSILEQSRSNVVQSINQNMVRAYWLIGREIVTEIQNGEEWTEYGKKIIEVLEFLDLPDDPSLHESKFENAILGNLHLFLLEMGKGLMGKPGLV